MRQLLQMEGRAQGYIECVLSVVCCSCSVTAVSPRPEQSPHHINVNCIMSLFSCPGLAVLPLRVFILLPPAFLFSFLLLLE